MQLLVAQEKAEYEELAEAMDEESRAQAALAQTHEAALEQQRQEFDKKLQALQKPEDYLDSFKHFVEQRLNQNAALAVVVKRPRDLTRAQLKEVKLLLDGQGYSQANLQSAVRQQSNQDIAASIIGRLERSTLGRVTLKNAICRVLTACGLPSVSRFLLSPA